MNLHRVFSGSPEHRNELIAAGLFVLVWFAMDVIEFVDWAAGKWQAPPICQAATMPSYPGYYCGAHDCKLIDPMPGLTIPAPAIPSVQTGGK